MFVWKLQQWPLEIRYMGAYLGAGTYPGVGTCLGHYGIILTKTQGICEYIYNPTSIIQTSIMRTTVRRAKIAFKNVM